MKNTILFGILIVEITIIIGIIIASAIYLGGF